MTVGKICAREVHLADAGEPVLAAAVRMKQQNVGCLVVLGAGRRPIGIVTDRDLVTRVMTEGHQPGAVRVEQVMTHHPRVAREDTPIEDALAAMRRFGVRRMPVVDGGGALIGIVSVDDALELLAGELGNVSRVLGQSLSGVAPPVAQVVAADRVAPGPKRGR